MKKCLFVVLMWTVSVGLLAVPATPYPIEMSQPDGSTVVVYLHGDETYSYFTRADGTPLRRMENGFFTEDPSVLLPAEEIRARMRKPSQTQWSSNVPLKGSPRSLVLLIGFPDMPFEQSRADFEQLLNQSGYDYNNATGSARDYFIAASDGVFSPQFDVYGPYVSEHEMAYYGREEGSNHDTNPEQLIVEACQKAAAAGVDMSLYDTDSNGILDNVFVFFAGHNQAEGASANTIWPHQSNLSGMGIIVGGVRLATYACTSEYRGAEGTTRASIGTFCHEFGHVLGLPDFYDTNYKHYTVGNWDIMCSGSYNANGNTPPTYTAYERFSLGWLTPTQLTQAGEYTLLPLTTSNSAYLIATGQHNLSGTSPNPSEFFLLEYRNHTGWDTPTGSLPGTGMLVWHIDYLESAWSANRPNNDADLIRMHLEEANGITWKDREQAESGRASDPYPGSSKVTRFIPKLHNGTTLNEQQVFNITEENGTIRFVYQALGDAHIETSPRSLNLTTTMSDKNTIESWQAQSFMLTGSKLDPEEIITLSTTGNFSIAVAEEAPSSRSNEWKKSITLTPDIDSTLQQTVWVSFIPTRKNCNAATGMVNVAGRGVNATVSLTGNAPRHTYVTTPIVKPVSDITPYSFRFSWEPVSDATEYYLTLYKVDSDGPSSFLQSFEQFGSSTSVKDEGWETTTNATTTSIKADGSRALFLKETGDCITSQEYPSAVTEVSFWISAFTADVDTVGILTMDAWNGTEWIAQKECTTTILPSTKQRTFRYTFNADDNYTRFRLAYTHKGGIGCALDAFVAVCSQNITYLYKGTELSVYAVNDPAYTLYDFADLTPSTTYYCAVQATDKGLGCEEHRTALSTPMEVITMPGGSNEDDRTLVIGYDSVTYNMPTRVVYVPNPANGNVLQIFDHSGRLVYSCDVIAGQSAYPIPAAQMRPNTLYIIKYIEQNEKGKLSMKRKQRYAKFIL